MPQHKQFGQTSILEISPLKCCRKSGPPPWSVRTFAASSEFTGLLGRLFDTSWSESRSLRRQRTTERLSLSLVLEVLHFLWEQCRLCDGSYSARLRKSVIVTS